MKRGDFSYALDELRSGERMRRATWPASMFVTLQAGYPNGVPINANTADAIGEPEGSVQKFAPYFMQRTLGDFVPWTASTSDLLAEDWQRHARGQVSQPAPAEASGDTEDEGDHGDVFGPHEPVLSDVPEQDEA